MFLVRDIPHSCNCDEISKGEIMMRRIISQYSLEEQRYLKHLSRQFPTLEDASREIINLSAILNLPKGTEHFLSDLHGEYEAFLHILKNGSGVIKRRIEELFGSTVSQRDKNELATLIFYPKEVMKCLVIEQEDHKDWYEVMLHRLVQVCREVSSKYTRSKVRKALPKGFEYIIEELLHQHPNDKDKDPYYDQIMKTIIDIGQAEPFIVAISELIQRLSIDHLHIIGDIYDRGPGAHIILDKLMCYHSVDIQWGNHDIVWMGAYAGSLICMANAIRISTRYGNQDILEEAYGINLLPLAKFAIDMYPDVAQNFYPKNSAHLNEQEIKLTAQMHKAISIIMFKLEGQFIERNPQYDMADRLLLNKIDYDAYTVEIDGVSYPLNCRDLPTIRRDDPYQLDPQEMELMMKLKFSFTHNEKLEQHVEFLFAKGSIYKVFNNNLLYHGCIPMNEDGSFKHLAFDNQLYACKELLDVFEAKARVAYANRYDIVDECELDIFWYLWTGEHSSLFGKKVMKTFERYFIDDPATHKEIKNPYYGFRDSEEVCIQILHHFGLDNEKSKIINGHVPVQVKKGESPVKAKGRLIVIDGGLSKAYQKVTGIAGYSLIYNSYGILIAAHESFLSAKDAIENKTDIISELSVLDNNSKRYRVRDTDIGKAIQEDIDDLKELLEIYKAGYLS